RFSRDWSSDVCSSDLAWWRKLRRKYLPGHLFFSNSGKPQPKQFSYNRQSVVCHSQNRKNTIPPPDFLWLRFEQIASFFLVNPHRSEERRVGKECKVCL